jgi:hypothetical protein
MNLNVSDEAVQMASVGILKARHREQESKGNQEKVYAIYANATPTPEDAHPAVKIVEEVFKEHTIAVAVFHANEAARFKAALIKAEALDQ